MSSPYPILDNRPIDQWKVTELKEELKRRKLKSSGKKDDLIKLLDQAIRVERENAMKERENAMKEREEAMKEAEKAANISSPLVVDAKDAEKVSSGPVEVDLDVDTKRSEKVDHVVVQLDINSSAAALGQAEQGREIEGDDNENIAALGKGGRQDREIEGDSNENAAALGLGKSQEGDTTGGTNPARVDEELGSQSTTVETTTVETTIVETSTVETSIKVIENVVADVVLSGQELQNSGAQGENLNSNIQLETEDSKPQLEDEGQKTLQRDDVLDSPAPDNQVSEVSANLGSQVKSDSISTDSVSINEKIELKDNIIADNVKLELDVNKSEMVEPPSSNVVPVCGESHLMDVEEPLDKASIEEKDDNNATNAEMGKKIDSADLRYSEKLNLDRSSGDDSMEEDILESKQIDSKDSSDEVRDRTEKNEVRVVKEESPVDVVGDSLSIEKKSVNVENKSRPAVAAEKRKNNGKFLLSECDCIL